MAKKIVLFTDKTEIMGTGLVDGKTQDFNLVYDKVARIQFDKTEIRQLFKKIPTEQIRIITKSGVSIYYHRIRVPDDFDKYMDKLTEFARSNAVSFQDNLKSGDSP